MANERNVEALERLVAEYRAIVHPHHNWPKPGMPTLGAFLASRGVLVPSVLKDHQWASDEWAYVYTPDLPERLGAIAKGEKVPT